MLIDRFIDEILLYYYKLQINMSSACDLLAVFYITGIFRGEDPKTGVLAHIG